VKAAAPLAAAPQAENAEYKRMLEGVLKGAHFGAGNQGILGMGGVSYLPTVSGTQTYSANALVSH
jgi:hypothetical protein